MTPSTPTHILSAILNGYAADVLDILFERLPALAFEDATLRRVYECILEIYDLGGVPTVEMIAHDVAIHYPTVPLCVVGGIASSIPSEDIMQDAAEMVEQMHERKADNIRDGVSRRESLHNTLYYTGDKEERN